MTKKRAICKLLYNRFMSKTNGKSETKTVQQKEQKRLVENIIQLQPLRDKLQGADLGRLDKVIGDLRKSVGDTVTKTNAAEMLDVSRQTLDKWIREEVLPTVKGENGREQIPRQVVERLTQEVRALRDAGHTRSVLAKALRNVADEIDPVSSAAKISVEDIEDIGS